MEVFLAVEHQCVMRAVYHHASRRGSRTSSFMEPALVETPLCLLPKYRIQSHPCLLGRANTVHTTSTAIDDHRHELTFIVFSPMPSVIYRLLNGAGHSQSNCKTKTLDGKPQLNCALPLLHTVFTACASILHTVIQI